MERLKICAAILVWAPSLLNDEEPIRAGALALFRPHKLQVELLIREAHSSVKGSQQSSLPSEP